VSPSTRSAGDEDLQEGHEFRAVCGRLFDETLDLVESRLAIPWIRAPLVRLRRTALDLPVLDATPISTSIPYPSEEGSR
jgi:hypothetical protein